MLWSQTHLYESAKPRGFVAVSQAEGAWPHRAESVHSRLHTIIRDLGLGLCALFFEFVPTFFLCSYRTKGLLRCDAMRSAWYSRRWL